MLIRTPRCETREILEYVARVRVKNMRPVFVHENAGGIGMIVRVAADVIAPVADQHRLAEPAARRSASTLPANPAPTMR